MTLGRPAGRPLIVLAALGVAAAALVFSGGPASADVTCPTVSTADGEVSPTPSAGVDWQGCDLADAALSGADLANANLSQATLTSANLGNADLDGANLGQANLTDAVLTSADLGNAALGGSILAGVRSGGIGIFPFPVSLPDQWSLAAGYLLGPDADLEGASLFRAEISGANLTGANLLGADLSGAVLSMLGDANLTDANLTDARIEHGTLAGANLTDASLANADLLGATFHGANLTHASLVDADLADGTLSAATVTGADLATSNLTGANLSKADLNDVDLAGANLTRATLAGSSITGWQTSGAIWSDTTCPNGLNSSLYAEGCNSGRLYGFDGFLSPARKSTLPVASHEVTVTFRLTDVNGKPINSATAAGLAAARHVRVTLAGQSVKAVTVYCAWKTTAKDFGCVIKIPHGIKTGKARPYSVTVAENLGHGFKTAPPDHGAVNPEYVYFK
jgi:uncharacterized protein YjbI with pentapeptide repeats